MDPSSWIDSECTPDGFEWKDPSKIRVGEVHCLLEYWRGCIACGLSGLIWVQNSPLFQDQDDGHNHGWCFQEAIEQPHYESDEEVFVLPQSDDIEEDEYESNDNQQHPYRSSQDYPPFKGAMEEVIDASEMFHPDGYISCECCMFLFDLVFYKMSYL